MPMTPGTPHTALLTPARQRRSRFILVAILGFFGGFAATAEIPATVEFRKDVQPILKEYCYDCHGDGAKKGQIAFDELTSDEALLNHDLWFKVLKNVRSNLMPPQKKPRPNADERKKLETWIKYA